MPGTRIKTARLSQVPEAQTGQSSPMLPQRKKNPCGAHLRSSIRSGGL